MSAPVKTTEPAEFRSGDTINWLISEADYPAGDGWSLEYTLINAARKIVIESAPEGNDHRVHCTASTTTDMQAGEYTWYCRAINGADVYTLRNGSISILPNLGTVTSLDARSHARKMLDALNAWLESRDPGVAKYKIGVGGSEREMQYTPIGELLKLQSHYQAQVNRESGRSAKSGRIYVRF